MNTAPAGSRLQELNACPPDEWEAVLGPIFEKSPWVARAVAEQRPFQNGFHLLDAMAAAVEQAGPEAMLALLRAHPDLGARLAERAGLTEESRSEQTAAGLFALDEASLQQLREANRAYAEKFGFPFILCARRTSAEGMLREVERRLERTPQEEVAEAWSQVRQIAELRMADLLGTSAL